MLHARPSNAFDVWAIASDMRPEDVAEVQAAGGGTPEMALLVGKNESDQCFTVYHPKYPSVSLAMFGYKATEPGLCGVIWMLASNKLLTHRCAFLRSAGWWVDKIQEELPLVYNLVDERNRLHIKWLKWMGFTFLQRHSQFGPQKLPFLEFVRLRHV